MCRNRPLYLIACVVSLAGPLGLAGQERNRLRVSVGGVALPEGARHEIIVEEQVDQLATSRITVSGRKGLELAGVVKVGDDVKVESGQPGSAADSIMTGEAIGIEILHTPGHHMVIRALNRLHRLTRAPRTREFVDVTDAEIVATIARENGLTPEASSAPSVRYDHVYQQIRPIWISCSCGPPASASACGAKTARSSSAKPRTTRPSCSRARPRRATCA